MQRSWISWFPAFSFRVPFYNFLNLRLQSRIIIFVWGKVLKLDEAQERYYNSNWRRRHSPAIHTHQSADDNNQQQISLSMTYSEHKHAKITVLTLIRPIRTNYRYRTLSHAALTRAHAHTHKQTYVTGSGKSGIKSPMIKQQKLAEMPFGWKIFNFRFWHISLNKMLYYTENVFI